MLRSGRVKINCDYHSHLNHNLPHSPIYLVLHKLPMDRQNQPVDKPDAGRVSVVLLQHWAQMISGLQERHQRASEAARVAQHQVEVLSREVQNLNIVLDLEMRRSARLENQIRDMANFTMNAIMWLPDVNEEHFLVRNWNDLINAWNEDNPIDLLEDSEEEDN